ncbi:aspartyl-phosphate phosphatase Spo0E family protein [Alkalicoccobacillus plakortidis]|uniref:Aspartyl-phosphate phosphatase Spo0E family protein n=1 Tax=Alkalicoccobacillus plakortidis TaxID=444060 RepID=A0ABT0XFF8_9BACI|nr:aspartyl-phosphate phosphatase Spo0E family protein [Alkalicoccobacillus plakortidis]MCM2674641.1 aspartyl-phosphate phosphatase Spo0E family protein [Alkalicoccobacillus plakortidis]
MLKSTLYEVIENKRLQLLKASQSNDLSSSHVLKISQDLDLLLNQYDKEIKRTSYS